MIFIKITGANMYISIAVLVVASAFPLVQILNQDDVKEHQDVAHSEDSEFQSGADIKAQSRKNKGHVHGLSLDSSDFNAKRSHRILIRRIRRRKNKLETTNFLGEHDLDSYIKFQHSETRNKQLYKVAYYDDYDDPNDSSKNGLSDPQTECQRVLGYTGGWITSVSSCPVSWTNDKPNIQQLCLSDRVHKIGVNGYDIDMLPVQTSDGTLYKNRYCAMCNSAPNPKYWEIHFICEQPSSLFFFSGPASVSVLAEHHNTTICNLQVKPPYNKDLKRCKVRSKRNGHQNWSTIKSVENDAYPISFSILMNFGFDGKAHIMFSTTEEVTDSKSEDKCQKNEILDPGKNKCRRVRCSAGFSLKEEACIRDGSGVIYNDTDLDKITNVDTLTNNNKIALISLEVNVTNDNLGLAMYAIGFKPLIAKKIATLLNITSERIQNFTIAFLNQSESSGHNVRIKTMTKEEFEMQKDIGENDMDTSIVRDSKPISVLENIMESGTDKHNDRQANNVTARTPTLTDTFEHKSNHTILYPQILQLNFILLPAHVQNSNVSVSKIIQKMNALLNKQTFKFEMNGTMFNIVDIDDTVANEKKTFCKFGIKDVYFDNEFSLVKIKDSSGNTTVYVQSSDALYGPGDYDVTVLLEGSLGANSNLTGIAGYVFVCINPRILNRNCARITICPEEYTLFKNKSILFDSEVYNMTQYSILDETSAKIEICVPEEYYTNKQEHHSTHWLVQGCHKGFEKFTKAEGYLTAVIGRLSIIALSSVLVTYCLFKSLRNLPGINTMNLTLALLLAETMFIEGEQSSIPEVCSFVAISVHYFFLASFFWMNVMSYDVYKTFANKCILTRIRKTRTFIPRYAFYAWGSPAVIVAVCIFVEYGSVFDTFKIGYGKSSNTVMEGGNLTESNLTSIFTPDKRNSLGCWINSPVAALVAFGAPVMLIFSANMIFFVRTIICIQATAKLAHISTRRTFSHMTGRNDVMLYVRMSTVMGFTWIFGLASSIISAIFTPPDNTICLLLHILTILFTFFNCAQGLFIFFAFVFKKRVYYLFRGLLKKIKLIAERLRVKNIYMTSASVNSVNSTISQISK